MEVKKYFMENRFSRMGDVIGEGLGLASRATATGALVQDIGASSLVEKKPEIHNPLTGDNLDKLNTMCREMISSMGKVYCDLGPKAGELYQTIRQGGSSFRMAESTINISHIPSDFDDGKVCRRSEYYESIRHLGAHFFSVRPAKLQMFDTLNYRVNYAMFAALGKEECKGLGSGQYAVEAKVEVLRQVSKKGTRRTAQWTNWQSGTHRYFNSKCQDIMSETSIKVEDLLTAMLLPRENSALSNIDMVRLRGYLHMGPSGCLVLRFMVLYLIQLRLWHAQVEELEIAVPKDSIRPEEFSTKGISNCLNVDAGDTVISVVNMTPTEQLIMARSVMGYKCGHFPVGGFDFYLGGFDVPSEVGEKGRAYLLGGTADIPLKVKVTQEDIYNTMVKYAMQMQACTDMEMGYNLAGNLIFADGLPNFSVPKPQGYVDIIATALSRVNTNGYVPPCHISELNMLGFMVLSRQQLLMVHDMVTYSETPAADDLIPVLRVPPETRQALYQKYKNERFSDAFGLSSIVDPLLLLSNKHVELVRNVHFPTIAWSSVNNDKLTRGTLSEYFWRGEWADPTDWVCLDATTQKRVKTTFLANGFLIRPVTVGVKVKSWTAIEPDAFRLRIQSGKVSTRLMDIECAPRNISEEETQFQVTPFKRQEFEDEDDHFAVNHVVQEAPSSYKLSMIDGAIVGVYFNRFGGEVGLHTLEKIGNNDPGAIAPILSVTKEVDPEMEAEVGGGDAENMRLQGKGVMADTIRLLAEMKQMDVNQVVDIRINPARIGTATIDRTNLAEAMKMFGEYMNTRLCKSNSVLCRFQHLLGRMSPEEMGLSCALREEMNMNGINRGGIRMWQLATIIFLPYLPQLMSKGVISLLKFNKLLALGKSVRHYGTARRRFNLKVLPSFDPTKDLYKAWLVFMRQEGFTITYKDTEMEDLQPFTSNAKLDNKTRELIELTRNMKFPGAQNLLLTWNYEEIDHPPIDPMTDDEFRELKVILTTDCNKCGC